MPAPGISGAGNQEGEGIAVPVDKRNIVLIGMPTAGKSTVGVMLARLMRYNFTDTDIVIQVNNDATLAELIARHGNERFLGHRERGHPDDRAGAHRGVRPAAARYTATTPLRSLRATGPVVYSSSCRWAALTRRMGDPRARGVVLAPGQTLADLLDQRSPLYEHYADITVDSSELSQPRTVDAVADAVRAWFAAHPAQG